jgi:hypothetical protein
MKLNNCAAAFNLRAKLFSSLNDQVAHKTRTEYFNLRAKLFYSLNDQVAHKTRTEHFNFNIIHDRSV